MKEGVKIRMFTIEEIERMSDEERRARIIDILSDGLLEWWKENRPPAKNANIEVLRKSVEEAKTRLNKAKQEAKALTEKAECLVKDAGDNYRKALASYRLACRKAGIDSEDGH